MSMIVQFIRSGIIKNYNHGAKKIKVQIYENLRYKIEGEVFKCFVNFNTILKVLF